jgi:hypothetical protein
MCILCTELIILTNILFMFLLEFDDADEEGTYDAAYAEGPDQLTNKGGVEHDVVQQTDNPSSNQIMNPYYGYEYDFTHTLSDGKITMDTIQKSDNPYYGGDPANPLPPHAIQIKDNPYYDAYYDVELDAKDVDSDPNKKNLKKENVTVVENPYYE